MARDRLLHRTGISEDKSGWEATGFAIIRQAAAARAGTASVSSIRGSPSTGTFRSVESYPDACRQVSRKAIPEAVSDSDGYGYRSFDHLVSSSRRLLFVLNTRLCAGCYPSMPTIQHSYISKREDMYMLVRYGKPIRKRRAGLYRSSSTLQKTGISSWVITEAICEISAGHRSLYFSAVGTQVAGTFNGRISSG